MHREAYIKFGEFERVLPINATNGISSEIRISVGLTSARQSGVSWNNGNTYTRNESGLSFGIIGFKIRLFTY